MSKIIIANFKANGCKEFFNNWLSVFKNESQNQILLAPPQVYLDFFSEKKLNFELCSQNVCEFEEGPFTSQHTASMLLDLGVKSCIIGHSESRSLLSEEDHQIFEKFQKLNYKKIRPVVCIGEPLEIRESNKVKDYLKSQTEKFHDFEGEIIFGYEPLWAIGSGKVPKLDEIEEVSNAIKEFCGENKKVLYGGSINSSNCEDILRLKEIDGALVGGASLNPKEFAMIAQSC